VAILADNVRPKLSGIERADSIAMDLHKWLHIPFEAACVLIRNRDMHRQTFSLVPEYLEQSTRGIASGNFRFNEYGIQLSRSFRALKIWMTIKEHGSRKLGRMISRNVEQARYLGELIRIQPELELTAPIGLDIVCFRFNPGDLPLDVLSDLNREILVELQEQGIAAPSCTTLKGEYCLRVAICNHRTRYEDFDLLVREIIRIGESLSA
jgi:glutamate/tyrosine decarboxylase-like PLP-dependent enzyme